MLLYLIRHAEPDYSTDSLTERGKVQAKLVASRLLDSGIDKIYSSPMGRAKETAKPLSEYLNLPIEVEPWAYELGDEARTTMFPDGKDRTFSCMPTSYFLDEKYRTLSIEESLKVIPPINGNGFPERYHMITEGLDSLLERNGYRRNAAGFYDPVEPNDNHIALFCHAAMQRVLFSHLLHVPYQFTASTFFCNYTGVSILNFHDDIFKTGNKGNVSPQLYCFADTGHLFNGDELPIHYVTGRKY